MEHTVVYATDENYADLTAVSLCSLLKTNPGAHVTVLAAEVSERKRAHLATLASRLGGTLRILDARGALEKVRALGAGRYVSFSAYSRLFIPALLGESASRAIYLDGDTLVTGSLAPLFALPLEGKPFAIGYDCIYNAYKKLIGLAPEAPYFNSGVLLIDLAAWQRQRCTERIFDYMANVRHDLMFGDQDYFALVLADDAAILPPAYNFLTHFQLFRRQRDVLTAMGIPARAWYGDDDYARAQAQPVVHHFLGHTLGRPWYRESLNPLRPLFKRLAAEAGVPDVAEQSRPVEFHYRLQRDLARILPPALFARLAHAMYAYFFRTRYGVK